MNNTFHKYSTLLLQRIVMVSILITSGNIFAQMSGSLPPLQTTSPLQKPASQNINVNTAISAQTVANESIRSLQNALNNRGFNAGLADGFWGPQTESAVYAAQRALGLPITGTPSESLLTALSQLSVSSANSSVTTNLGYVAIYATHTLAYGISYNFDNEKAAINDALKKCQSFAGGETCVLLLNEFGPRCVAVARGTGGLGTAAESNLSLTRTSAIKSCQNYATSPSSCKVTNEYCARN